MGNMMLRSCQRFCLRLGREELPSLLGGLVILRDVLHSSCGPTWQPSFVGRERCCNFEVIGGGCCKELRRLLCVK
eukprot:943549-Amphidinium_carterae.1